MLVTKKRAAEAALSLLSADTFAAEKDAADATQAKVAFEQSSATVRTALTQKVKDLANRQHEYANELRAIEIVASALCGVARLRAGAVERCLRETSESLGRARAMYADAAKAHCNGQLSAARYVLGLSQILTHCLLPLDDYTTRNIYWRTGNCYKPTLADSRLTLSFIYWKGKRVQTHRQQLRAVASVNNVVGPGSSDFRRSSVNGKWRELHNSLHARLLENPSRGVSRRRRVRHALPGWAVSRNGLGRERENHGAAHAPGRRSAETRVALYAEAPCGELAVHRAGG